jgi:uncharacterized membrane protein YraQ (UPF0718 family)
MNKQIIKQATQKTFNSFKQFLPILVGMLLLVSLLIKAVPKSFYVKFFTGNLITDSLFGALFGSIATGNPITSYIIGGELLSQGVSLVAITTFIVTWVTVGTVQMPAEIYMLGKKFTITRNITSFLLAIIIGILTVITLKFFYV